MVLFHAARSFHGASALLAAAERPVMLIHMKRNWKRLWEKRDGLPDRIRRKGHIDF